MCPVTGQVPCVLEWSNTQRIVFILLQAISLFPTFLPSSTTTSIHNYTHACGLKGIMYFDFIHTRKISGKKQNRDNEQ